LESIPGLHKRLKIRALSTKENGQKGNTEEDNEGYVVFEVKSIDLHRKMGG
jgi:hypothetical protein